MAPFATPWMALVDLSSITVYSVHQCCLSSYILQAEKLQQLCTMNQMTCQQLTKYWCDDWNQVIGGFWWLFDIFAAIIESCGHPFLPGKLSYILKYLVVLKRTKIACTERFEFICISCKIMNITFILFHTAQL